MPPPTQLYAIDRTGFISVFDPLTLAAASGWSSTSLVPYPGPALGAVGFDNSSFFLYLAGIPGGTASYLYPVTPVLSGGFYSLGGAANAVPMPASTFLPGQVAIDTAGRRLFVADDRRALTAWNTNPVPSGITQLTGSPYFPSGGVIKAQGVAYNPTLNRVYVCCQNAAGQDQVVVYNASTAPMTPIAGSPFSVTLNLAQSNGSMAFDAVNSRILITCPLGLVVLNATTLAPIAGSPFATGGLDPRSLVIDTVQSRVYINNFGSDTMAALSLATLAPIAGSPYATGHGPGSVVYSTSANRVYVSCYDGNPGGINVFNPTTAPMTVVAGSPFYSGSEFLSLAVGP